MSQMIVQKASIHSQIYNQVLTSEQKATADQMRAKQMTRIDQHLQKLAAGSTTEPAAQ
jgi:hypothetical protein